MSDDRKDDHCGDSAPFQRDSGHVGKESPYEGP